ncbi:MAG: UDP-N-acetylmuramoyl-L-alanine--D-glutamate ligase, partial [Lachnospiraceae bacterium]
MRIQMDLQNKKVLVVGTGISGIAAAELLAANDIRFDIFDGNQKLTEDEVRAKSEAFTTCPVILGDLPDDTMDSYSYVILSPGVPTDLPMVDALRAHGAKIWGEIELAYAFSKGDVLAITGTNGKTTTTALTGEILKNYVEDVRVVGNIGIPYTSMAGTMTDATVTVAEISSFQLETVEHFAPKVSAILNITPDHLNRHHTMENYIAAKERITEGQHADQVCVLNYEDEVLRGFGEKLKKKMKVLYFSSARELDFFNDTATTEIYTATAGKSQLVCNVN